MAKKWLDFVEKQGRRIDLKERYRHTYTHTYTSRQAIRLRAQRKCRCHGNRGRPYKILHGCIQSAIPEKPVEGRNICGLFAVQVELQAILAQISLPWQQGSAVHILHGCIESAIPENPLEGRNICGLFAVQVELQTILAEISLPWQQLSARLHFVWFHSIGHPRKPPNRCKHLWPICHTSRVIGDFWSNFWESILGVKGPKSKIEEQRFVERFTEN